QTQRPEQSVPHRLSQWLASDLFNDQAEQRVVGVVVLVGCTRRKIGWVCKGNGQQLGWGPNPGRVMVHTLPDFGGIAVVVETATHVQQLGEGDVVAIGHTRDV